MAEDILEFQVFPSARQYRGPARHYRLETWTVDLNPLGGVDYGLVTDTILGFSADAGLSLLDYSVQKIGGFVFGVGAPKLGFRWTAHAQGRDPGEQAAAVLLELISDRIFWRGFANTTTSSEAIQWQGVSVSSPGSPGGPGGGSPGALETLALVAAVGALIFVIGMEKTPGKEGEIGASKLLI